MKMIRAIVRPERERKVIRALEDSGIVALTKVHVTGRGRQGGVEVGLLHYAELAKTMLMLVVAEEDVDKAVNAIANAAYTGYPGDGRIFVSAVDRAVRLRTGEVHPEPAELGA
jgi:nitrogen regulatory protein PII 1